MIINSKANTAITFEAGAYPNPQGGAPISFNAVSLKTAIITLSQAKQIVKTQIQGRDGTVKEYVGMDDYAITVVGTITNANGVEPVSDRLNLKAMLDAPIALDITCPFLNQLGIQKAVVESYDLPQNEGGVSYQTFTINLISDIPVELRITGV